MIISDLSYLEVVSEASSIVGGQAQKKVANATAKAKVANPKKGTVAAAANTSTNATITNSPPKQSPPIKVDQLLNNVNKEVNKILKEATK